jgi:SAM-dependent methyltransferase
MKLPPSDWYRNWDLGVKEQSWVEDTARQAGFAVRALGLKRGERILDLACGFGRHSLELARQGFRVVGVDIMPCYVEDAAKAARGEDLPAEFVCADIRDVRFCEEFDAVLNLADGAIGYLEDDGENLRIFRAIASALRPGGKSLIDICNREHAEMHFPKKHWEIGSREISLPVFDYDAKSRRMLYGGFGIRLGEVASAPESIEAHSSTRLYSYGEVKEIFAALGVDTVAGYGGYDFDAPLDHRHLQMVIVSVKRQSGSK